VTQGVDRAGAWADERAIIATTAHRRGNRIEMLFATVYESGCGPKQRLEDVRFSAAVRG
jgi:hypothetical protein